jgi:hypothetical protein
MLFDKYVHPGFNGLKNSGFIIFKNSRLLRFSVTSVASPVSIASQNTPEVVC